MDRTFNAYENHLSTFVEGFMTELFSHGILNDIDAKQLQRYFANPDKHHKEIEKLTTYLYISNGEVFQLLDLVKSLPSLKHKIKMLEQTNKHEKNLSILSKFMNKVKHKSLTRDLLSQTATTGTLIGMWLGDKKKLFPYIFDELKYIYPAYRRNGDWIAVIDLSWFDQLSDIEREIQFRNFSFLPLREAYEKYHITYSASDRLFELPQERTFVLRTHTLKRNQRYGISWATTGLFDILHKNKLKDMEKSVANKIINAIAVLTVGSEENPEYANMKLSKPIKQKIHHGVKNALEKKEKGGVTVVTIPEYASLDFPDMKSEALDPKKFESINSDVDSAFGISSTLKNGQGANFASAKLNLEILYRRIGVLLEEIETEVYAKAFNILLPTSENDNYYLEYDKSVPLSLKERLDYLNKLHVQEGFSLKAVIDLIDGVEFNEYIEQSIYEQETLKLQEKIKPYASAYTGGVTDEGGAPTVDSLENESTVKTQENNGNSLPTS
jgi:hypothetical protein